MTGKRYPKTNYPINWILKNSLINSLCDHIIIQCAWFSNPQSSDRILLFPCTSWLFELDLKARSEVGKRSSLRKYCKDLKSIFCLSLMSLYHSSNSRDLKWSYSRCILKDIQSKAKSRFLRDLKSPFFVWLTGIESIFQEKTLGFFSSWNKARNSPEKK